MRCQVRLPPLLTKGFSCFSCCHHQRLPELKQQALSVRDRFILYLERRALQSVCKAHFCPETYFKSTQGLPWWRSGWESACQCRGHGFEPWSGKIPHAAERLGPWATIAKPVRLEPVLRNKRGRDSERPAHRDEEWPPLAATRESRRTETKTQHGQK